MTCTFAVCHFVASMETCDVNQSNANSPSGETHSEPVVGFTLREPTARDDPEMAASTALRPGLLDRSLGNRRIKASLRAGEESTAVDTIQT